MTDTPTPPMTQKQRALLVGWLREPYDCTHGDDVANMADAADQLEADGETIATLTAERDAAQAEIAELKAANKSVGEVIDAYTVSQVKIAKLSEINVKLCADFNLMNQHGAKQDAEIARLTAALATAREDGMREAMQCCQAVANEAKSYNIPQMTMGANTCRDAILDAIKKGAAT